ncbi:N-acetyltransferase [Fournierella sp.]|uniref:GNAT family N-acetyltransferase n=1 Tax=Allofournierella sp. TaxID=1940256 RepID=UPI0025C64FF7|nr:N-acetyltransferase [Fournierella sp.]
MNEAYCERLCIEQGRPEDAEELLALLRQVGSETDNLTFGAEGPAFTIKQEREYLRAMAENPTSAFFVARLDGRMVGSLSFRAMTLARASHRAEMGISVLQECWGKGVGNRLMEAAIDFAKNNAGVEIISLEVRADNTRAQALYRKYGFEEIGRFPGFFQDRRQVGGFSADESLSVSLCHSTEDQSDRQKTQKIEKTVQRTRQAVGAAGSFVL